MVTKQFFKTHFIGIYNFRMYYYNANISKFDYHLPIVLIVYLHDMDNGHGKRWYYTYAGVDICEN